MEIILRIAGAVVAVVLGAVTGVYEVFYSNLRIGAVLMPAAMLVAFGVNVALTRFCWYAVGTRWAPVLAIVPWVAVMIAGVTKRTEGDWLVLPDNWAGALMILAGMAGFAVPFLRLATPRRPTVAGGSSSAGPPSPAQQGPANL
ncbi:MAG: hypothetical protein HOV79_01555 [Hamadaea sp.]|nr:hypothetical protein [Hamadaea sp.]